MVVTMHLIQITRDDHHVDSGKGKLVDNLIIVAASKSSTVNFEVSSKRFNKYGLNAEVYTDVPSLAIIKNNKPCIRSKLPTNSMNNILMFYVCVYDMHFYFLSVC